MTPTRADAYKLLHDGCVTLSAVESNGMKVDVDHLDHSIERIGKEITRGEGELREDKLYHIWRREYGAKTKLGSREQLGNILFNVLGHPCSAYTKTGRPKTDGATFEGVDEPFVVRYLEIEKLKKVRNTFLTGIKREVCNGFLHPVFNLHTVQTYRSSSNSPNFQNFPIRDPQMGEVIRRCFIARPDHHIVEIDYSGIEVRIATCYHQDPEMKSYIEDPSKDMHRDMAAECYKTTPEHVSKEMRYCGKNMFVFPQFYGDYYLNCSRTLWEAIDKMKLQVGDIPLKEHLRNKGISSLGKCNANQPPRAGTFERHIRSVERDFWDRRFRVYNAWKQKWWHDYQEEGGFTTLTGFRIDGVYGRNDVINYPIQGSAFHCLLWSLIRLHKWLTKNKMRSLIVGQIHDSIVADVHEDELEDYLSTAKEIMTKSLPQAWDWINIPLEVEAEVTPINGTWHEKKERKI
jgi:DNA polymerase-1